MAYLVDPGSNKAYIKPRKSTTSKNTSTYRQAPTKYRPPTVAIKSTPTPTTPDPTPATPASTSPKPTPSPKPAPTQTTSSGSSYNSMLRELINRLNEGYQEPSDEEILSRAQRDISLQVDPLVQQLQAQREMTEAQYSQTEEQRDQMLEQARAAALESAIARGGGRSGAVNWETEKRTTPIMTQWGQYKAQQNAALSDLANRLTQLQQSRGDLVQQRADELRSYEQGVASENRNALLSALMGLRSAGTASRGGGSPQQPSSGNAYNDIYTLWQQGATEADAWNRILASPNLSDSQVKAYTNAIEDVYGNMGNPPFTPQGLQNTEAYARRELRNQLKGVTL